MSDIELIIGTYEEFLLGYKVETTKKVRKLINIHQYSFNLVLFYNKLRRNICYS